MIVVAHIHSDRDQVVLIGPVHSDENCHVLSSDPHRKVEVSPAMEGMFTQCGFCLARAKSEHADVVAQEESDGRVEGPDA